MKKLLALAYSRFVLLLCFRCTKSLKIGKKVVFINTGTINSINSYLGYIENESVRISNKSNRSYLNNSGLLQLGDNVRIHKGFGIRITGELTIGNNTYINPDSIIVCHHKINIGKNCNISWNVTIMDDDLHETFSGKNNNIIIEDNVWIGANVFITKGVVIGTGSVIGAGTIVTKNVPAYSMVAGNPGKVLKENIIWK